jgi:hypothetical protein
MDACLYASDLTDAEWLGTPQAKQLFLISRLSLDIARQKSPLTNNAL